MQTLPPLVIGIDVGTSSARAGLFDSAGIRVATQSHTIQTWKPKPDYAEQSSRDIWGAIVSCVRGVLAESGVAPERVVGISFDATCSMVVAGREGAPLAVNDENDSERDIIVWMDHRATAEADEINAGGYDVLRYVGGKVSPEMQTPKLLWLKRHLPDTWKNAWQFFDLPDWLTWRATGSLSRSHCTLVCKWTYLGHENNGSGAWDASYFRALGIDDALPRIGTQVRAMGTPLGTLTPDASRELALSEQCIVGQGIIDAHAGGLGVMGAVWANDTGTPLEKLETALALIGGTSNCHMAVSREPKFVPGVWGPYYNAMVPGMWLTEGGQSAAGSAIDHAIADHANANALQQLSASSGKSVYELLNAEIARQGNVPTLTSHVHVLSDFIGNRSPHADPHARGMYDGVSLDRTIHSHALRYYATLQAVAYGTRDIIDALNANGYSINTLFVTGGGTKNPLWLQEHADATGATLILPEESEAVLLGTAVLAATAAGLYPGIHAAMRAMSRSGQRVSPRPQWRDYHDAKFSIYRDMYRQQKQRVAGMARFV